MDLNSKLVNSGLRLKVLQAEKPVFDAWVERVDGNRMLVTCGAPLAVGAAVQLDTPDRMLLAEVLSFERVPDGTQVLLEIQHALLWSDVQQVRAGLRAPVASDSRANAAGV
ncbi:MAG: hypothetical protein LAQ30_00245 [Acidobacteriia bacterium]|nr:hypothetical protein [Terriglobia bacterium]